MTELAQKHRVQPRSTPWSPGAKIVRLILLPLTFQVSKEIAVSALTNHSPRSRSTAPEYFKIAIDHRLGKRPEESNRIPQLGKNVASIISVNLVGFKGGFNPASIAEQCQDAEKIC